VIVAENVEPATFLSRPNKFLVVARLESGQEVEAHLADPGRLKDLLYPGVNGWVVHVLGPNRKTAYDFIAVKHEDIIVSLDTRVPNHLVRELLASGWLFPDITFDEVRQEYRHASSRVDFYCRQDTTSYLIEVKSAGFVDDEVALFPDAPTKRGTRHVKELISAIGEGYTPIIVFVIQRPDASSVSSNRGIDPAFSKALSEAWEAGVRMVAFTNRLDIDAGGMLRIEPICTVPVRV
jgi:sugar fermentation stimulation protein A